MNQTHFLGNMVADPELRQVNDKQVVNFVLAVNTRRGQEPQAAFLQCEAWNKTAELVCQHLKKGDPLIVHASVRQENWEKDGQKRSKLVFVVNGIDFVPRRRQQDGEDGGQPAAAGRGAGARPGGRGRPVAVDDGDDGIAF